MAIEFHGGCCRFVEVVRVLLGTGGQQAFLIVNLTHSAIDSDDWTVSGAIGQYNVETLALPKVLLGMQLGKHLYELACSTHKCNSGFQGLREVASVSTSDCDKDGASHETGDLSWRVAVVRGA